MTTESSALPEVPPAPTEALPPAAGRVAERLQTFSILPNRWARMLLGLLPYAVILWFAGGLLQLPANARPDYFLLTAFLCVVIDLFLLRYLFDRAPEALFTLWKRGLFKSGPDNATVEERFLTYLQQFEKALNHPFAHVIGVLFAIIAIGTTWAVLTSLQKGTSPFDLTIWERPGQAWRLLYLPLGFFVGELAWRVFVVAYFVYRLGTAFVLKIQTNHPDGCGGLKPLGDLCQIIALLLIVPSIYYSIWGFINVINKDPSTAGYGLWATVFRCFLFILILATLLAFFRPLYSIHQQMLRRRAEIQNELDRLSQEMDEIIVELRAQVTMLTPKQGAEKLETLAFMQKVYDENAHIPTWPLDWKMILRFASAQALPVISLIASGGPVLDIAKKVLGLF